ncbi:D-beta-D-heptose 1-phosphate adenosyltransferase [Cellulomonas algicola]|uniref:D-beta-D-heptose 1-phosphate adenosyltransferase n=1 Tax=Cellulomonas algicola TaxID=2071633 RepID=A0A401UYS7_9CELL|nr:DeoR/GlpR family DNA-binding transcription regulator [Cellulomonas algicola]GCD19765.1 D-beta-D-heptose 1-phosphate adenosyltransferase [Cellulomonas algicola]
MTSSTATDAGSTARRLPAGRKAELAAYVAEVGEVTVAQLADRFDVSADTIRRDLDALDADGVLIRTHGGAVSTSAIPRPDTGLDVRMRLQTTAKERIGALAATLVHDGSAIVVNAGTTTLALARHLADHSDLTIATNSLRLATEIAPKVYRDLYVFGGAVRASAQATVGPVRLPALAGGPELDIRCDLAIIGVGAVAVDAGYSTSNLAEAQMMGDMMDRAARVAVLADSSKFGRRLFAQIADLGRADYLVTDVAPPHDLHDALRARDVEVLVAAD